MPATVEEIEERVEDLERELTETNTVATRLSEQAAIFRADGQEKKAENCELRLSRIRSKRDTLREALEIKSTELREAERETEIEAARTRLQELQAEAKGTVSRFHSEAKKAEEAIEQARQHLEAALPLRGEHRGVSAEVELIAGLFDEVEAPEVEEFPDPEFSDLLGRARRLAGRLRVMGRRYPKTPQNEGHGLMLQRRVRNDLTDEPGSGRVYSRARGIRSMLSEATGAVVADRLRQRLGKLWSQIKPDRRDQYKAPKES